MQQAVVELRYALDTFYLLISGALVMWMAAGFALLEGGLVRAKNTAAILTKNIALCAVASLMYLLVGYSIMYPGEGIGTGGSGIGFLAAETPTLEGLPAGGEGAPGPAGMANLFFQTMFAVTALSIISGAVAERMKLWALLGFAVAMSGVIYPLQGYWAWGGGFVERLGFLDFAGSGVVHLCGATAALAGVLLLGPRQGRYGKRGEIHPLPGANLPLSVLGVFILWLGWFGFTGGSELWISDLARATGVAQAFVNTHSAAAGGLIAALIATRLLFGKADLTLILNGALAGLVAITAEPLTPGAGLAALVGGFGGVLVVFAIVTLDKLKIDDPVGAIAVHGVAGFWGLLAVPLSNPEATFGKQLSGLLIIFSFVFLASFSLWWLLKISLGIRVSEQAEVEGVDLSECGLKAYPEFIPGGGQA